MNPSRFLSNGLEASCAALLKDVDNARSLQNPAIERGLIEASVDPQTMTSASLCLINLKASPIACNPVAQAVLTA